MNAQSHTPSRRFRLYLTLCIFVPVFLAAGLMTVAFFTQFDTPTANYFRRGAALPVIAGVFAGLAALVGTVAAVRFPKKSLAGDSLPIPNAALPEVIGFLSAAAFLVISIVQNGFEVLRLVPLILSLFAAVYALVLSLGDISQEKVRNFAAPLGFVPVFALIFLYANHYFDRTVEMNAPEKTFLMLGLLTAAISFTGELRYLIGSAGPRAYLMLLSWTVAAGALCIPAIPAAHFFRILTKTDYVASSFAVLGCFLTSCLRLFVLLNFNTDAPAVPPDAPDQEQGS